MIKARYTRLPYDDLRWRILQKLPHVRSRRETMFAEGRVELRLAGLSGEDQAVRTATAEFRKDLETVRELEAREVDVRDTVGDVPGASGKGPATELIVSLGASGSLAGFARIVKLWLSRDRRRSLTVSIRKGAGDIAIRIDGENISTDTLAEALMAVSDSGNDSGEPRQIRRTS